MLKRLLILMIVSQMLFISAWANAHMSAEPHQAYESVHLHFDNLKHEHSDTEESEEHDAHSHLCFCALDFSDSKQLPQLIHTAPLSFELAHISHQQSPPTPPPTV